MHSTASGSAGQENRPGQCIHFWTCSTFESDIAVHVHICTKMTSNIYTFHIHMKCHDGYILILYFHRHLYIRLGIIKWAYIENICINISIHIWIFNIHMKNRTSYEKTYGSISTTYGNTYASFWYMCKIHMLLHVTVHKISDTSLFNHTEGYIVIWLRG